MVKLRTFFAVFIAALLMSSCSKDYRVCIPSGCQALMAVDLAAIGKDAGIDAPDKQEALKKLLMTDDVSSCGIDVTEKLYGFETADGDFGFVAKVGSKSDLGSWLDGLAAKGVCKNIGEKKGYDFYLLKESFLVTYSSDALIVVGPVVGMEQSRKQIQMARYLDAGDDDGAMQSKMFERLEQMNGPVAFVARSSALPEKLTSPIILGAPKGTDASEVLISADMAVKNGVLCVSGDVFSFNQSVDDALKKAAESYRAISGTFIDRIPETAQIVLATNIIGSDYLRLLRTNEALRTMLMGINTAIDIDKMIASVDGDMLIVASGLQSGRMDVSMTASVSGSDWVGDVAYWKKSCPAGTVITDCGTGNLPQYSMSGASMNAYFGMADPKTMYISTGAGVKSAADAMAVPMKGLGASVASEVKGKRFCVIVNLDALSQYKSEMAAVTGVLRPLLGDVHTLVYAVK